LLAQEVFPDADVSVGVVGMITALQQANEVLSEGKADIIFLAHKFLRDTHFALRTVNELGITLKLAVQYKHV